LFHPTDCVNRQSGACASQNTLAVGIPLQLSIEIRKVDGRWRKLRRYSILRFARLCSPSEKIPE
jgi:hypothetical protein